MDLAITREPEASNVIAKSPIVERREAVQLSVSGKEES